MRERALLRRVVRRVLKIAFEKALRVRASPSTVGRAIGKTDVP